MFCGMISEDREPCLVKQENSKTNYAMMTLADPSDHLQTTAGEPIKYTDLSPVPVASVKRDWEDEYSGTTDHSLSSSGEESEPPSPREPGLFTNSTSRPKSEAAPVVAVVSPSDDDFVLVDLGPDNVENFFRRQFSEESIENNRRSKASHTGKKARPVTTTAVSNVNVRPEKYKMERCKVEMPGPVKDIMPALLHSPTGTGGGRKLWEFLLSLLCDSRYNPSLVKWLDAKQGVFTFTNSRAAACLWGQRRGHSEMSYEHMSRAIRHYYKSQVILRVPGRRLVYRFGPNARGWWQKVEKSKIIHEEDRTQEKVTPPKPHKRNTKSSTKTKVVKEHREPPPKPPPPPPPPPPHHPIMEPHYMAPSTMDNMYNNEMPQPPAYYEEPMEFEFHEPRREFELELSVAMAAAAYPKNNLIMTGVNGAFETYPYFGSVPQSQSSFTPEISDILADTRQVL